jgi:hypothetical protein
MKQNIKLLYGFSFCDQFMIVIPLLVPYLGTKGIGMGQFMELQAVFALVIVCGEVPTGLLSDKWGRRKTLLLGSVLKAASFSLLPLWSGFEGFLFYHLTMGIALSLISGGDVAFLYDSHLTSGGKASQGTRILGNAQLAKQTGVAVSALLGGAIGSLSYDYLLWLNAVLGWIPVLFVFRLSESPAPANGQRRQAVGLKEILSTILVRDGATRLVFLNMVAAGVLGLVMAWTNQRYWQDSGVPLIYFGVLWAGNNLIAGIAGKATALAAARYGQRALLAAAGILPIVALLGMSSFFGWGGILLGLLIPVSWGLGDVLFLDALNQRIPTAIRATVNSMASLCIRAIFSLLGPLVGYGIDGWGLSLVLAAAAVACSIAFVFLLLPLILRRTAVELG